LIGVVVAAAFWILRPRLPALVWASLVTVAACPMMLGIQAKLWSTRSLAVAVMTAPLLLMLVVPLSPATAALLDNTGQVTD
jgi:hypothetical protein